MFSGHTRARSYIEGKLEWLQLVIEFVCFVAYIVEFECKGVVFL